MAVGVFLQGPLAFAQTKSEPEQPKSEESSGDEAAAGEKAEQGSSEEGAAEPTDEAETEATATAIALPKGPDASSAMRAYQSAMKAKGLGATGRLSRDRVKEELSHVEEELANGRRDEAIFSLVYLVESSRFDPFRKLDEGRAAVFLLGDALGRAGAIPPARRYLRQILTETKTQDVWYRRAVRSLVDLGLAHDKPELFLQDLAAAPGTMPDELNSDVLYLQGRALERAGKKDEAIATYARVSPRGRFWAQANYLAGLLEVDRRHYEKGEALFCKIADPKQTPREAAVFGGNDFFRVRDLSRLALGRVAHEQYRFDDSRYYYYLVPQDSDRLPEALYESANSRYEAKDYEGARELMDELEALGRSHPYEDEAIIFDAYVDLATCKFERAGAKLKEFIARYEPVRNAARRLSRDPDGLLSLVDAVRLNKDPAGALTGTPPKVARTLGALLRVDPSYGQAAHRLAQVDHQLSGLSLTLDELGMLERRIENPKEVVPRKNALLGGSPDEKYERLKGELAEVGRLLAEAERSGKNQAQTAPLRRELETLKLRVKNVGRLLRPSGARVTEEGSKDLSALVAQDRNRALALRSAALEVRDRLLAEQTKLARDALLRLDRRISRLLRRARLGRVETVLGKKRSLEIEIEALSQGLLPRGAVDSLDAARYLRDDEEYWPFDGEDWADEYVGGEGLE